MTEIDTINATSLPPTVDSLAADFAACGMAAGQTVLVHSSMSKIGWIVGGAQAVIMALLRVLGDDGTLMMPAHSAENSDPTPWQHPPVPETWWPVIREHTPGFDPLRTPTREMGAIPELFRTWPDVIRSYHPVGSFAAIGPNAAYLTADHPLELMFGDGSPIGKLYELDGYVLLLGAGHGNNTSLHLAETRGSYPNKPPEKTGSAVLVDGVRQWIEYEVPWLEDTDFPIIGVAYEAHIGYTPGKVGQADARFLRQRPMVDFAVEWMNTNRDFSSG